MIRFVAEGRRGRILGLGLSFDNLRLLAQRQPIAFELAPYGSRGTFLLACGSVDEVVRFVESSGLVGSFIVRVDEARLDSLRAGEALPLDLEALGVPGFADAIVFAGATEFEVIDSLRSAGLLNPDTPLEGLEEYRRHEAGQVEDCPLCQARSHGRSADTLLQWNQLLDHARPAQPAPRAESPAARTSWREALRSPLVRLFGLVVVVGAVVGGLVSSSTRPKRSLVHAERQSEAQVKERVRVSAAEKPRISFLEQASREALAPRLSENACGAVVKLPQKLGSLERDLVQWSGSLPDRGLGASLEAYTLYGPGFDLLPPGSDPGSAQKRLGPTPAYVGKLPEVWPTLVVEQWTDAVFPPGAGESPVAGRVRGSVANEVALVPVTAGRIRARLLLWGYAEQRLICASAFVEAETPPVLLTPGADLKNAARLETVLAAFRAAALALRVVDVDTPGGAGSGHR